MMISDFLVQVRTIIPAAHRLGLCLLFICFLSVALWEYFLKIIRIISIALLSVT